VFVAVWGLTYGDDDEGEPPRPAAAANAPNVLMIVLDDATAEMVNRRTMPNTMRELGRRGTSFDNFIVTNPLCCPSRANLLTGQYGHNNNVLKNAYKRLKDKGNILPRWLQRAGYRTMHVGKYLNNFTRALKEPTQVPWGWDEWFTMIDNGYFDYRVSDNGEEVSYGSEPDDYVTRVLNQRALDLVAESAEEERPFYLQLDHFAPHPSPERNETACGTGTIPDPDDRSGARDWPVPDKRSRNEADVSDKPPFMRSFERLNRKKVTRAKTQYRCAVASLPAVDRGVGRLIDRLRELGELERTAIFFTSDNGYYFGEHRIPARKEFPYEENLRMPLLLRLPDAARPRGGQPARIDALSANIDLAPTILELAHGEPCEATGECRPIDGRSLLPLLDGDGGGEWPRQRSLLVELDQTPKGEQKRVRPCSFFGVRSHDRVLIRHRTVAVPGEECRKTDVTEHYDLATDPEQLDNLASTSEAGEEERRLRRRLQRLEGCEGNVTDGERADPDKPLCE
jgi:N-acetylglucosamine-6-sulfatase